MSNDTKPYHHGHLAESLLDAVDDIATRFGLEAVTLRACAKKVGVSPSSAFRHYADKRALLTAFATRAIQQLADAMGEARQKPHDEGTNEFFAVGMAYIAFALDKPAFFRAMWREEIIYVQDEEYLKAACGLSAYLKEGFVSTIEDDNPNEFSAQELLAWSAVHGLANLFVDGPVGNGKSRAEKLAVAAEMLLAMQPVFKP